MATIIKLAVPSPKIVETINRLEDAQVLILLTAMRQHEERNSAIYEARKAHRITESLLSTLALPEIIRLRVAIEEVARNRKLLA